MVGETDRTNYSAQLRELLEKRVRLCDCGAAGTPPLATGSTPERFKEIMQEEVELWAKVIRDGNIKVQ